MVTAGFSGTLYGGQQPIVGSTVRLFSVGTSGYGTGAGVIATAAAPTSASGNFTFNSFTCPSTSVPTYLLSIGGDAGGGANSAIVLAAASGACGNLASSTVNINEVTTAATAYAMSHFFTTTLGSGSTNGFGGTAASGTYNQGLIYADLYTVPALVDLTKDPTSAALGNSSEIAGPIIREQAKLYSIANILAVCVNSTGPSSSACTGLFSDTTYPSGATAPANTLQAAVQMALYPFNNVGPLYNLPPGAGPFDGQILTTQPNDWSLAISYSYKFGGLAIQSTSNSQSSSTLDIDETGNIWFPTNSTGFAGNGIGEFMPSQLSNGTAFAPLAATYLSDPQYVIITAGGNVFANDMLNPQYGQSGAAATPTSGNTGPFSEYSASAVNYTDGGTSTTPASYYNFGGGSSFGSDGPFSQPAQGLSEHYAATSGANTDCNIEQAGQIDVQGTVGHCYAGGLNQVSLGRDVLITTSVGQLCDLAQQSDGTIDGTCFTPPGPTLSLPKGLEADGDEAVWIANSGNSSVSTLADIYQVGNPNSPFPTSSSTFVASDPLALIHSTTMPAPYGLAIDRSGNVWVSNRSCFTNGATTCTTNGFILSELIGAAAPTATPIEAANALSATGGSPTANIIQTPVSAHARYARPQLAP